MSDSLQRYEGSQPGSLSMGFSRQEYWHGLPCPPSGDLPDLEPVSLMSPALVDRFFTTRATWEALSFISKSEVFFIHQKEWALESNNGSRKKKSLSVITLFHLA